jgi:hypothetical protein
MVNTNEKEDFSLGSVFEGIGAGLGIIATGGTSLVGDAVGALGGATAAGALTSATPSTPAIPAPVAPPTPPTTAAPAVTEAETNEDETGEHGQAANILAGGMYQAPPQLARNILLGN